MEVSIRESDIFIGTILKSLEIEDLVCCNKQSQPCFLARSFIGNADEISLFYNTTRENVDSSGIIPMETDDKFYEAPETLAESADYSSLELPKFSRITGLLPSDASSTSTKELSDTLESFVKAQIVIYDQNSTLYNNTDKQVSVYGFLQIAFSFMWFFHQIFYYIISGYSDSCYPDIFLS